MPIKVVYQGIEMEASTAKEAAQLVRELQRQNPFANLSILSATDNAMLATRGPQQSAKSDASVAAPQATPAPLNGREAMTHNFLSALRNAGHKGMTTEQAVKALGIQHPKGVGARSLVINEILRATGFEPEQVYDNNRRGIDGRRVWTARGKLEEALNLIGRAKAKES